MTRRGFRPAVVSHPTVALAFAGLLAGVLAGLSPAVRTGLSRLAAPPAPQPAAGPAVAQPAAVDVPFYFEANAGQFGPDVQFSARRPGMDIFLGGAGATLSLQPSGTGTPAAGVRLVPVGAGASMPAVGLEPLAGKVNYLVDSDAPRWTTGVSTYAKVAQPGVYPGIDFHYYGNAGRLEYDVVVAPGADPSPVRLALEGATSLTVDAAGDLVIGTPAGPLTQHRPVAFQDVDGARLPVAADYQLLAGGEVGFRLGAYDPTRALVIDPTLAYSSFIGGGGIDNAQHVDVDGAGNVYLTGFALYNPTPYPTTSGAYDTAMNPVSGNRDVVVTKLSPAGAMVWSTFLGGDANDNGFAVAVHTDDTVYVTGNTVSTNFPTANAFDSTMAVNSTNTDSFVTRLAADGASLVFSTYLGGTGADQPNTPGIALDSTGAVFTAGHTGVTGSQAFPTTAGAFQTANAGPTFRNDAYLTKLNADGTMGWSTLIGGTGSEMGYGVAVDATGVYLSGSTGSGSGTSTVFPTTSGAYDTTFGGGTLGDAFVAKFNLTGTALVYSTYIGAAELDTAHAVAVDSSGNAYLAGVASAGFPTTAGAYDTTYNLGQDGFVAKLSADGSQLLYSTYIGSPSGDSLTGIAVDSAGAAYITGSTGAAGWPVTADAHDSDFGTGTNSEAVLAKIVPAGLGAADLVYSTLIGRTGAETSRGPALDGTNGVWVVGSTASSDFPTTAGALDTTYEGLSEGFVMKFDFAPADTDPPETTIDTGPSDPTARSSITFTFSADEGDSTFECNFDGAGFADCSTPATYDNLRPGSYTFEVRATDPAGNVDPTPATFTFRVIFPSLPGAVTASTTWSLRDSVTTGPATTGPFSYGARPLVPLMGDWDGDGVKTPGTFEAGVFKLRNSNSAGTPDVTFSFGDPRGFVVAGDFDGDGTDDVGVFRNGLWQTRITGSEVTGSFTFGSGTWPATIPVVGDWDGDGTDGIGTYTYSTGSWSLRNTAGAGAADLSFTYTAGAGSYPVAGDWDGDGVDSVGVKLGTTWSLRNSAAGGPPDVSFTFGLANDLPVVWALPQNPV